MQPYLVATCILVPAVLLVWLLCILYCVYKYILTQEAKERGGSVVFMVQESKIPTPLFTPTLKTRQNPTYAPVTSHVTSNMSLAEILRLGESGLEDSLGPTYYPKLPVNAVGDDSPPICRVLPSPMAPLQPPWPRLPPLDVHKTRGRAGSLSNSLNASNLYSSFLNSQSMQTRTQSTRWTDFQNGNPV